MIKKEHQEIEVRFLEIDKEALIKRLLSLDAKNLGEDLLEEIIIYDKKLVWQNEKPFKRIRLRVRKGQATLTYKCHLAKTASGTEEIEFEVSNKENALAFLEKLGFVPYRHQEKKRHTYTFGEVTVDIDTWPRIPTYVELEGPSENALKDVAKRLGFNWNEAVFDDARSIIENRYSVPVGKMRYFTFTRFE